MILAHQRRERLQLIEKVLYNAQTPSIKTTLERSTNVTNAILTEILHMLEAHGLIEKIDRKYQTTHRGKECLWKIIELRSSFGVI